MTQAKRRTLLYGAGLALAGILLFAGFGITIPPDPSTRLNGASFLAGLGQIDQALAECDRLLEEHPDNVEARIFRATFLAMAQRYDEAIRAYDDALVNVTDEEMRRRLELDRASVLLSAGREEEFRRERDRLAGEKPGFRSWMLDGLAAEHAQKWAEAAEAYREAHAFAPDDEQVKARYWNALMEKGRAALSERRFAEACEAFETARPLYPRAAEASLKAAEVRLAMGEPEKAVSLLRPLGTRAPGVAPLVFRAATQLLGQGRRKDAVEALAGALAADADGVRVLLEADPAWRDARRDRDVSAVLESKQVEEGDGLTPRD